MKRVHPLLATACAAALSLAPLASGQVVINEFQYDDTGTTDDREFVELYNAGGAGVDISGWTLGGQDASGANTTTTIPAGTILAPGAYWVVGNAAVQNVNQVAAGGFLENDAETIELRNGGVLVDAVVYEGNKGSTSYGTLPADVLAQVNTGGNAASPGFWPNHQGVDLGANSVTVSVGRFINGADTNNTGRDFGTRPGTPGASNLAGGVITPTYVVPDVDALTPETDAPGLVGSFVNAKVINPTVVSLHNQNSITASPQGGNAITVVDTTGGGNVAVSLDVHQGSGTFNINAYLETADAPGTENETTMYGTLGSVGSLFNTPDPSGDIFALTTPSAGDGSGVGWLFQRFGAGAKLYLVDAGDGGNSSPDVSPTEWDILQTIDLSNDPAGWHRLAISVDAAGNGLALYDDQAFNFTTDPNLNGSFYVGYREGLAGTPATPGSSLFRPPTFDISTAPIPEPASLGVIGLAAVAGLRRRRQR